MSRITCSMLGSVLAVAALVALPAEAVCAETDPWREVFAGSEQLAQTDDPLVCILTIQHPDLIRKQLADKPVDQYSGLKLRRRVEESTGLRCLLVHFTELEGSDLDRPNVKAILITGRSKLVGPEHDRRFYPLIRETRIPIFGFCGGMQLISQAFSAEVVPLRKLREGEADPNPGYHPGQFKEWGYTPVRIVRRDPLFEGLPDEIVVREAHAFHVAETPAEFDLLASTAECPVQAIKHRTRPVYGTQFHPEVHDDDHPHGRVVVENFFRLAGLAAGNRRCRGLPVRR